MISDVLIENDYYIAEFSASYGGNCYRLFHKDSRAEILRSPKNEEELLNEIFLFGNPVLFPPNRIKDGRFCFDGREYRLPVNEPENGCHIHGDLYRRRFTVERITDFEVVFGFSAKEGEYIGFPNSFSVTRKYSLDVNGLSEVTTIKNLSDFKMPFMLAFHTTFNVPFICGSDIGECFLKGRFGRKEERDPHFMPIGIFSEDKDFVLSCLNGEYRISSGPISAFFESDGEVIDIVDKSKGYIIRYSASSEYRYRMLWRRENADFFVVEPQTCAIDCFHLDKSPEKYGLISLEANEEISLKTAILLQKI